VDLIHPSSVVDAAGELRSASDAGRHVLIVGGRTRLDRGNPTEVDAELWTTQLDGVVSYEPAEMVVVVGAGTRFADLDGALAEGGQEWPADAPAEATIGGILASDASSPRRARVGALRDSVLEVELVTGDGRVVRSGGRTVKNVTGYDLHKLVCGSLGTLGVAAEFALKVRPRPQARRVLCAPGGGLEVGGAVLAAVPEAAGVLATADDVAVLLEGWASEVDAQTDLATAVAPDLSPLAHGTPFPPREPWADSPVVVEAAVAPSKIGRLVDDAGDRWGALMGVGLVWCGIDASSDALSRVRERSADLGGIAPVIRGPGGLGDAAAAAPNVQRRLKDAFDPAGTLSPGRFWGGI
jgi:glycolate dehydrogenase FAD-binding subunit